LALILNLVGAWILLAIVHVALGHFDDVSGVGEQLITYGMVFLFSIYAVALVLVSFRKLFVPIMVIYPGGIWDQMIGYVAWEAMQPCGPSVTRSIRPVAHFIPPFIPFWLSHVSAHFEFQVSQETADNVRRMRLGRLLGGGAGVSGRDNVSLSLAPSNVSFDSLDYLVKTLWRRSVANEEGCNQERVEEVFRRARLYNIVTVVTGWFVWLWIGFGLLAVWGLTPEKDEECAALKGNEEQYEMCLLKKQLD
jgi:hypothetical protein